MRTIESAIAVHFFSDAPDATHGLVENARLFDLCDSQRAARPYPHARAALTIEGDTAPISSLPGASLGAGPFIPRRSWEGSPDERRYTHLLLALTNAKPGQDEAFDSWYWDQHFPDGLRLPGCYAGRRYALASGAKGPFRHLAIYQFDLPDIGEAVDAIAARSGTPDMPLTDTISSVFQAWFVEPTGAWNCPALV
ncbi:hypothetical protein [Hyphomonas johnsonii]|uniref:hypothetical protein n=1 Tax=Hyphomonas johnsonii TaxID=81031 RepID=UPI0012EB2D1E|nr:hypothetical protein [Hyphomonas johnsonii]